MQLNKLATLISQLHRTTVSGSRRWEMGGDEKHLFVTRLQGYRLTLERGAMLTNMATSNVILKIYNGKGQLVEECSEQANPRFTALKELYPLVQEKTMEVEAVLDALLAELEPA